MSAVADLWKQATGKFSSTIARYWLLASRPDAYFDKYIKGKNADDLREVVRHFILAITAVSLVGGAIFAFKTFAEGVPEYVQLVLTKQYPLFFLMLVGTAPPLLLFYVVYRIIGASVSDLAFIYFNVLILWIIVAFAIIVATIILGLFFSPIEIIARYWPDASTNPIWSWVFIAIIELICCTIFSPCYYVPLVLFEKSTGRSLMFSSGLCISASMIFISIAVAAIRLTGTGDALAGFGFKPPLDLLWCTGKVDATLDEKIAGCTVLIGSGGYNDELNAAFFNRANAYATKHDWDHAIADYGDAIRLYPGDADALIDRGIAYLNKGEYERAIADFTNALKWKPNYAEAFYHRGIAYRLQQQEDLAIADFNEAIKINPKYTDAFYNRGITYVEKAEYDAAIADFAAAIRLEPGNAKAFIGRGKAYSETKQYDRAIADYSEAIKLEPNNSLGYNGRGSVYFRSTNYLRAIADFNDAIRLDPTFISALYSRAMAYGNIKKFDQAITDFNEVIRLDPSNAEAYFDRAISYRAKGDTAHAKADFDTAKRLGK